MKVTEHLKNANSTLFSFELLPPLKGRSIESVYKTIDNLIEFKPIFINITYHREEYIYKERENGYLERVSIHKRPGTVGICAAILTKYKIDPVPHLICGGFTKEETENALIDLQFIGIQNVLTVRGDPIKTEPVFVPEKNGHIYTVELVEQISEMNKGKYLYDEIIDPSPTDFCIGIAGYPEKHFESPNLITDIKYTKKKVDAGADFIITQMFFDNQKYYNYVKLCRENGINIPIIPGLKPITLKKQLSSIPRTFYVEIPEELTSLIEKCRTNDEVREVGIEWCIQQSRDLIKNDVPCIHYFSMGIAEPIRKIAERVF